MKLHEIRDYVLSAFCLKTTKDLVDFCKLCGIAVGDLRLRQSWIAIADAGHIYIPGETSEVFALGVSAQALRVYSKQPRTDDEIFADIQSDYQQSLRQG